MLAKDLEHLFSWFQLSQTNALSVPDLLGGAESLLCLKHTLKV